MGRQPQNQGNRSESLPQPKKERKRLCKASVKQQCTAHIREEVHIVFS